MTNKVAESHMRGASSSRVFFGIVLYNTHGKHLKRLLKSIEVSSKLANIEANVYILDNSEKNAVYRSSQICDGGVSVNVLKPMGNVGFGKGQNAIVDAVKNDWGDEGFYCCINPDGMLTPQSILALNQRLSSWKPFDLLEAKQMPCEHPKVYDARTGETLWCSGACLVFKVKDFIAVGGFDEDFFMYCEDVDLSWRFRLLGGKCYTVKEMHFFHDLSDGRASFTTRLEMLKSGRILAHKYGCDAFLEIMNLELVQMGFADSSAMLPVLHPEKRRWALAEVAHIVEFRRLFNFSSMRWEQ